LNICGNSSSQKSRQGTMDNKLVFDDHERAYRATAERIRASGKTRETPSEDAVGVPLIFDDKPTAKTANKKESKIPPILANAIGILKTDPAWWDVLAYNEFSLRVVTKKSPPWGQADNSWNDYCDSKTAEWLQVHGVLVNSKLAGEAAGVVARENSFHPVRDYLKSLKWDRTPRLDSFLIRYFGAEDKPFSRAVGGRWLISAVARIFQPGCQVDHTLLLEGPQGIRKSTALRVLASDEYFTDHISDLGSKDSRLELAGKWIIELSELDRVRRGSEQERVKAFLTARYDNFRAPYARRAEDVPRSCVFAASTNDDTPLTDASGGRRFWPMRCGTIRADELERDRDQLWAEAYKQFRADTPWWLDTAELTEAATGEQEQRYDAGVWDEIILAWIDDPQQRNEKDGASLPIEPFESTCERTTITDVLIHAVGKSLDRCTQADKNQVARCLIHARWTRKQSWAAGERGKWFYFRGEKQ
jgi:putative DNA primase/helicase